jgi:hypothetical protein
MVCLVLFLFFRWWVLWALVACNDWFNCEPLQFSLHSRVKTTLLALVLCCCNALALPGYSLVETETALWGCNRKRYSRLVEVEDTRYRHEIDEWVCFISNHIVSWAHLTTAFLKQTFVVFTYIEKINSLWPQFWNDFSMWSFKIHVNKIQILNLFHDIAHKIKKFHTSIVYSRAEETLFMAAIWKKVKS